MEEWYAVDSHGDNLGGPGASRTCRTTRGRPAERAACSFDDHTAEFLGASGNLFIQTPNLDRFASQGMRLSRMFTAAPSACRRARRC